MPTDDLERPFRAWWQERIARLSEEFQTHDIWYVPGVYQDGTWCSRPKGSKAATINRGTEQELREAIQAELATRIIG
jgi:hypothetical protein